MKIHRPFAFVIWLGGFVVALLVGAPFAAYILVGSFSFAAYYAWWPEIKRLTERIVDRWYPEEEESV